MILGLSSERVSADGFEWSKGLLKSEDMEVPKQAAPHQLMRRQQQRQPVQQQGPTLSCPRCDSTNTKFCYYNNYSRSQPRHFCKACRRHWTNGGTLRNVPVGGRRKAKRPRASHQSSAPNSTDADAVPASQPSQQGLLSPSRGIVCGTVLPPPLPPLDYADNGDISNNFPGTSVPLAPVPPFGSGMMASHDVNDVGSYASSTTSPFTSLFNFTGQDELAGLDAGMDISTAAPWELLPPSACSSGLNGNSTISTSCSGPTTAALKSSSSSSGYWGSCWDDLTGFLSPDDDKQYPPPPLPPPQDLQLS